MAAQIWAVASGKGGIGKTFVTSSLGITLSKMNQRVLLIDLDFGGANLHSALGMKLEEKNIRSFFLGNQSLQDLILPTGTPRLSYIQGLWDHWGSFDVNHTMLEKLMSEARNLPYDLVILDLSSGFSKENVFFFKNSDEKLLIGSPDPMTLERNYRFVEAYLFERLQDSIQPDQSQKLQKVLIDYRRLPHRGQFSFSHYMKKENLEVHHFDEWKEKPIRLIMNGSRSRQDEELGYSIKSVCKKYYELPIHYLGAIDYENAVWQCGRVCEPVLIEKPFTPLSGQFVNLCKQLVSTNLQVNYLREVV